MRKVSSIGLLLISALFVGACSSDGTLVSEAPIGGTEETGETGEVVPVLSDVSVIASSNVLQSDGALPVDITARVVDENNNAVPGITVEFSTDSGVLVVSQSATDAEGRAIASLSTEEDPTNRTISVTAEALSGDGLMLSSTVQVEVIGTELAPLSGPSSLVLGAQGTYTAVLLNANDNGIAGVPLTITSALGNTIALNNTATDVDGRVEFTLSAQVGGDDQITVSGLGISSTTGVSISSDSFAFITPAPLNNPNAVREIPLNTPQPLEVLWTTAGNEVVGQPIQFSTTRGVIMNTGQVLTDGNGIAGNSVMAADAGRATITASNPGGGPSTQLTFEFVATVPDTIEVQADPFNVGPNEQSAITAVVRDPAGNLVKNQIVIFELSDETGGVLTVGTAITDSQGRAQTFYQASASTSANEGVTVAATVQGSAVTDSVSITVARREVFFSFGTGNTLEEPTPASYSLPFIVQATVPIFPSSAIQ
ncbi:MAG: Ig-like domain-containing protein, partial [Pseudomonadota bacterium]